MLSTYIDKFVLLSSSMHDIILAASGSLQDVSLLRPKEFLRPRLSSLEDDVFEDTPSSYSQRGSSVTSLRRPKDFIDPSLCDEPMYHSHNYLPSEAPQSYNTISPSHSQTAAQVTAF